MATKKKGDFTGADAKKVGCDIKKGRRRGQRIAPNGNKRARRKVLSSKRNADQEL